MIEEWYGLYVLVGIFRSLLFSRKTAGLLFRPEPALTGKSARLRVKRYMLRALKHLRAVETLTILPFFLRPEYQKIADHWVYDFQLWDVSDEDIQSAMVAKQGSPKTALAREILEKAGGRKILIALGSQSKVKGFDRFAALYAETPALQQSHYFVAAGKVSIELQDAKADLINAGGYANDAYISDEELVELYGISDLVWAYYSPAYDQASGIFGRAIQFRKSAVVRAGSLIERFADHVGFPVIAFADEDFPVEAFHKNPPKFSENSDLRSNFAQHSRSILLCEKTSP